MTDFGDLQRPQHQPGASEYGSDDRFGPVVSMSDLIARRPATVRGCLGGVRTIKGPHGPCFEAVLDDTTGSVVLVFLGRRSIPGFTPGMALMAQGTPRPHRDRIEILNPLYELLAPSQGSGHFEGTDDLRSNT